MLATMSPVVWCMSQLRNIALGQKGKAPVFSSSVEKPKKKSEDMSEDYAYDY
jgi:hypothetical protein